MWGSDLDEGVVDQFIHGQSVLGSLVQTLQNEIFGVSAYLHSSGEIYIVVHYLHQVVFRTDLERHSPVQQLVRENT
jgi:hypothetical protein